jgi:hypothetical protein
MPFGSRNANKPKLAIMATTAYAPLQRLCTPATASNAMSVLSTAFFEVFSISCANTFSNTSESELVLMCRKS